MSISNRRLLISAGIGFLLLAVLPIALLYPVSNYCSPPVQSGAKQHDSGATPQADDDRSPIVKFFRSLNQAQDVNAPKQDWGHAFVCNMKIGDFFIATFAYWLAVATVVLLWAALRHERALAESLAVARKAADIVDETLKRTERPQVLILFETRDFSRFRADCLAVPGITATTTAPDLTFYLRNFGRQVAIVRKTSIGYGFYESPPSVATMRAPINQALIPQVRGDTVKCNFPPNWEFDREKINQMIEGKLFFWFAALVEYADGSGGQYETEILWRYSMHNESYFGAWDEGGRNRNT